MGAGIRYLIAHLTCRVVVVWLARCISGFRLGPWSLVCVCWPFVFHLKPSSAMEFHLVLWGLSVEGRGRGGEGERGRVVRGGAGRAFPKPSLKCRLRVHACVQAVLARTS